MPACLRAGMTTSSGGKRDNRKGQGYSADILATQSRLRASRGATPDKGYCQQAVAEVKQKQQQGQQQAYKQQQRRVQYAAHI